MNWRIRGFVFLMSRTGYKTLEDDIELEAECRGKIEFETAEDQLSILTHKLEHEMDELAKLEEEVVKVT